MAYRESERRHHTRFGWWLMTHDRGGATVIGAGALVVLAADLAYVATRWDGSTSRFDRGFVVSGLLLLT